MHVMVPSLPNTAYSDIFLGPSPSPNSNGEYVLQAPPATACLGKILRLAWLHLYTNFVPSQRSHHVHIYLHASC